jgi:putative transmembrane protein PGPGW
MRDYSDMAESQPSPRRGDREIWGDDPEEIDASAVVEQIAAAYPDAERRWHDHPLIAPFKAVALFIKRSGKRIAVTIAGGVVILVGIAMLVLPGPGLLVIIAGLAILATEYVWAERLLRMAKERAVQAKDKVLRKKANSDDGGAA